MSGAAIPGAGAVRRAVGRAVPAWCLSALLVLGGCTTDPPAPGVPPPPAQAQRSAPAPVVPPAVSDALLPPLTLGAGEGAAAAPAAAPPEPRFDVSAVDLPAGRFFMSLVNGTSYDVVVDPGVKGNVSLHLKGVTVPGVMRVVRDIYGFEYERHGRLYEVFPPRLHSRLFQVSYLDVKRRGASRVGAAGARGGATLDTSSEADFWRDLRETLAGMVGDGGGRKVLVNPAAGLVVVQAYAPVLRQVKAFLTAIQRAARRAVRLEARVLEVRLNERARAGIDWDTVAPGAGGAPAGAGSSGTFARALPRHEFGPLIRALQTQGEVRVLSSPRLSTVNNQQAVIKAGTDEFFVTDVPGAAIGDRGVATGVTLTPFFSGIALDVTPQIGGGGDVMLHIHPEVSDVQNQTKRFTVGDRSEELPLARRSIRESDSVVRAASGQVVMIGGMLRDRSVPKESSVPVLGDIPLLGRLFRHTRHVTSRSELVILLRPTVVGPPVRESYGPRDGSGNIAEGTD